MAKEKLTALDVERFARERPHIPTMISDGGGLYLRVGPIGACSWVFKYMKNGRSREMGLGSFADFTLAEARDLAVDAHRLVARGKDPIEERKAARGASVTFADCAATYIANHKAEWGTKAAQLWASTLTTYAAPIAGLPVGDITIDHIESLLKPIWTSKHETAIRVRGRIENVIDWAIAKKIRQGDNPARWRGGPLKTLLAAPEKIRATVARPALPFADLPRFMADLRQDDRAAARSLEFCILTAARTGEVLGATWSEIDIPNRLWTIPASRMKAKKEHRVPLSGRAMALLGDPSEGALFGRLSDAAMKRLLDGMGYVDRDGAPITVHGFRSTFRDWAAEKTDYPHEMSEMALAHAIGKKVEAAYRRGDMVERRRAMMSDWAKACG